MYELGLLYTSDTITGDAAYNAIQNMRDVDGEAVYNKIDVLTTEKVSEEDKKKLKSISSNSSNQEQA